MNNEKLARWQGLENVRPTRLSNGTIVIIYNSNEIVPDYLNDDAAAMSLLDTLVEKGYEPCLEYDACKWMFAIWKYEDSKEFIAVQRWADTIPQAITQAVLKLIESEAKDENV